jgi:chemotaxis protein methyltransferase CheR
MTADVRTIGACGPDAWPEATLRPLSDRDFARFRRLVGALAGINLTPAKKSLFVGRLGKRLRACGLGSFGDYFDLIERDEAERTRMIDALCTNETHFFREPRQFAFLAERAIPVWREELRAGTRPPRIRVWSAACSTGEEPYSLAMALLDRFPAGTGWEIEILASDISTRTLAKARQATWPIAKRAEIPRHYLKRFMLRGTRSEEGRMCAGPEIRGIVRFEAVNLVDERLVAGTAFDAIFCRNVLIYFDAETKARVVDRLLEHLLPGGLLFLGQAESLTGTNPRIRAVGPSIYARADLTSGPWAALRAAATSGGRGRRP